MPPAPPARTLLNLLTWPLLPYPYFEPLSNAHTTMWLLYGSHCPRPAVNEPVHFFCTLAIVLVYAGVVFHFESSIHFKFIECQGLPGVN